MLTKVQDRLDLGSVAATCAAMSPDDVQEAANQFVTVLTRLVVDGEDGNSTLLARVKI
jgi:hypothetical protein